MPTKERTRTVAKKTATGRIASRTKKSSKTSRKEVVPLSVSSPSVCRGELKTIVESIRDSENTASVRCNAVEVLELLLDAGQYSLCMALASQVSEQLTDPGQRILFKSYSTFAHIAAFGEVTVGVKLLARQKALLEGSGCSVADCIRGSVLLARAKIHGVAVGCLQDYVLSDARALLSVEFEKAMLHGLIPLAITVGLEICRLHIHGITQDQVSGVALIKLLHELSEDPAVLPDTRFDLMRSMYYVSEVTTQWSGVSLSESDLRAQARLLDPLTQALVELASIRRDGLHSKQIADNLEGAYAVCESHGHLLGAFEIAYRLALSAQARGHFARAERWYRSACDCAERGNFLHGRISSTLGLYNSTLSSGSTSVGGEPISKLFENLEQFSHSEMGTAAIGLNLVAMYQNQGNYSMGGAYAKRLETFFREHGLVKQAGQAAFSDGACSAGTGEWKDAYKAWRRALGYDQQVGDDIGAAERKGAMAQAIAMEEFTKTKTISPDGMKQVRELLDSASKELAATDSSPEHIRAEAKLLQTYAQLSIIGQVPIEGLKHLQRARTLYQALEMTRESALMDALSGLALLEVAKRGSPQMYEEAGHALQRALHFFSSTEHTPIRWKIKYYLSLASYFHSQTKNRDEDRMQWRATAAEWLRDALADSEIVRSGETGVVSGVETDFSPGLGPEAMDPLKVVLGLVPSGGARVKKSKVGGIGRRRISRQLH